MSLNEKNFYVKVKTGQNKQEKTRELCGRLTAFDEHLNIMMTDCSEKITLAVKDPLSGGDIIDIQNENHSMLFIRGD